MLEYEHHIYLFRILEVHMKSKTWLIGYGSIVFVMLSVIGVVIYHIDPYMHYHYPHTEQYNYELTLNNERYQNDGIMRHFDYNAVITGSSMTEQFKTTEMDELFGTESIKIPYSGASYKEINDNIKIALKYQPKLKTVIRGLDMNRFFDDCDVMRYEPETYPTYLYNENPFDDVKYLYNRDAAVEVCQLLARTIQGTTPGITPFDEYPTWPDYTYGINTVCPNGVSMEASEDTERHLTDEEKIVIQKNIYTNVISLAEEYPDVTFYCFFPPYSAIWWMGLMESRALYHQIEAEQYIIELILECENIRLYSFNNQTDIITNLNHYNDEAHYGSWINSLMLQWMYDGEGLLTKENYMEYLEKELFFYRTFDYESLNGQEDYENDADAATLLK